MSEANRKFKTVAVIQPSDEEIDSRSDIVMQPSFSAASINKNSMSAYRDSDGDCPFEYTKTFAAGKMPLGPNTGTRSSK